MVIQGMNWLFCVQHVVCFILIVLIAHTLLVFYQMMTVTMMLMSVVILGQPMTPACTMLLAEKIV